VFARSTLFHHRKCSPAPTPSEPGHVPHVYCVSLLHQHRRVWVTALQGESALSGLCSDCEATAMVVKRKTRNKSNTHHTPTVPRVQPLLKCAPSCHVRGVPFGGRSAGGHPLNVACSWTAPITTESHSSSPISNSPSHKSSSQSPHSLLFEPSGGGWPHTAVKQDCRKVTHTSLVTIRPPASSCHLRRGSNTLLNPFRRAGFAHVTRWWMNRRIMHFESCSCRVR
jgi:hypothetical protein